MMHETATDIKNLYERDFHCFGCKERWQSLSKKYSTIGTLGMPRSSAKFVPVLCYMKEKGYGFSILTVKIGESIVPNVPSFAKSNIARSSSEYQCNGEHLKNGYASDHSVPSVRIWSMIIIHNTLITLTTTKVYEQRKPFTHQSCF